MIDLKLFCDDSREELKQPFNDEHYTHATNGHVLIRVVEDPQYDGNIGIALSPLPFDHDQIKDWFDLPDMPEPARCGDCGGTGKVSDCPECDGGGEVELENNHYSYTVDCKTCDGEGYVDGSDRMCPLCDGLKKRHIGSESLIYQEYRINLNLLEKLKTLPNVKLGFIPQPDEDTYPPIRFKFDGGCGLLMPMRQVRNDRL